jgi:hypothetical protein
MVVIEMALSDARARLLSCSACDLRRWMVDGRPASLDDVLSGVPRRSAA